MGPGPKTILSGVHVAEEVELADGFLYHTVPVIVSGNTAFVTVAFHHSDDLKVSADLPSNHTSCLSNVGDQVISLSMTQ